jgi:hypothetical protein
MAAAQALFDATEGVLAARGPDAGPAVDLLTRARREREVDQSVAWLNEAEAARRTLALTPAAGPAAARSLDRDRSLKAAMLARFRSTERSRQRVQLAEPVLTLRVRASHLTSAGRAALEVLQREAAVEVRR